MENSTCNGCINKLTLYKHPSNNNVFKGAITESTGLFACIIFHKMGDNGHAILFDKDDAGGCEMYEKSN